jgi:hypothetical protein
MEYSHIGKEELDRFYCLTWSFSQGAFHVGKLLEHLEDGMKAYRKNRSTQDYILLDVSTSDRLLRKRANELQKEFGRHPPTEQFEE